MSAECEDCGGRGYHVVVSVEVDPIEGPYQVQDREMCETCWGTGEKHPSER